MRVRLDMMALLLAGACAPRAATVDLRAALAHDPASPSLLYIDASAAARRDAERALAELRALDAHGWDNPLETRDFAPLADNADYRAIAASIAARGKQVSHATIAAVVAEPELFPEGIAVDAATGSVYLSSLRRRKIIRVRSDGTHDTFADASSGLYAVLGLHVDRARRRLWAASDATASVRGVRSRERGRAILFAFDLDSGNVITHVVAPSGRHLFNDVDIAEDGTVYVTDSDGGGVFSLAPGATTLRPFVAAGTLLYPNGIVVDGPRVLVAHAWGIAIAPRDGGVIRQMGAPENVALGGVDGMALLTDTLYAVQNGLGRPRIVSFALDTAHARALSMTVLENQHPALSIPTTLAIDATRGSMLIVADSHIDRLGDGSAAGVPPTSTILTLSLTTNEPN